MAWEPLGWSCAFVSEVESFPNAVLAHRYPDVPNHGDMTKFKEWPDGNIDLLVGGTPCQSFSVAGLRGGLDDPRGNLMLTYLSIADRYRPRWLLWENVPGVLHSSGGRDFGSLLGGLAQLGYGFAYRVLDAEYFGVPQRRRRVYVVGHAGGDWQRPAAVLFEQSSLQGCPEKGGAVRQGAGPAGIQGGAGTDSGGDTGAGAGDSAAEAAAPARDFRPGRDNTLAYAWQIGFGIDRADTEICSTMIKNQVPAVMTGGQLRRVTPVEGERLMGFPDGYTRAPWKGKPAEQCPDAPRFAALGNSMAVPVMRWIGSRIAAADAL
jgi:DNA (cytosine-5)-methyltransferase 1